MPRLARMVVAGLPHHVCQDFRKQAGTGIMDSYLPPLSACDALLCRMNSLIHMEPRPQYAKVCDDYLILVGLISGHSDFVPKLTFFKRVARLIQGPYERRLLLGCYVSDVLRCEALVAGVGNGVVDADFVGGLLPVPPPPV